MKNFKFIVKNFLTLSAVGSLLLISSCYSEENSIVQENPSTDTLTYELPEIEGDALEFGKNPVIKKQVPFVKIPVVNDVSKLMYDEQNKDVDITTLKDTVILYVEGGPIYYSNPGDDFKYTVEFVDKYVSKNYSTIAMRQYHNYNPTVFGSGASFTDNDAEYSNSKTLDMIETAVKALEANNKVVYLFGHSNGSFMVQDYIVNNRVSPNGYLIAGTRIKKVQAFFDYYPKNIDLFFENGVDLSLVEDIPENELPYFNVLTKLQLNHFKEYTSLLLSRSSEFPKLYYSFAGKDINLGRIEPEEINFLTTNNINGYYRPEGDHSSTINDALFLGMNYFRRKK